MKLGESLEGLSNLNDEFCSDMMPLGRTRRKRNRRSFSSVSTSTASKSSNTSSSSASSSVDTFYSLTTSRSKKKKKDASRQQKQQHQEEEEEEEEEGKEDTHPEGMVTAKVDTVGKIISRIPSDGKKSPESGTYTWCSRVCTLFVFVPYFFFLNGKKASSKKFHNFLMNPLPCNSSKAPSPIYEALCIHVSRRRSTRFVLRSPR